MNGWPAGVLTVCLVTYRLDDWQDSLLDWLNDWLNVYLTALLFFRLVSIVYPKDIFHSMSTRKAISKYCDMTPESRNSEVRMDVHCWATTR
jgi:hypothetical protein